MSALSHTYDGDQLAPSPDLAILVPKPRVYVRGFCFKAHHWCQAAHHETFGGRSRWMIANAPFPKSWITN